MNPKYQKSRIIPAIDIRDGNCVRLSQGDYSKEKIYSSDPVSAVSCWDVDGISFIHVVDLDGAKQGRPINLQIIAKIAKTSKAKIEVGGGIRTENDVESVLNSGAARVILGTSICENPSKAAGFIKNFGAEKIVAGIDAKNGIVATRGWIDSNGVDALALSEKLADAGIIRIIYTDISTDGMLSGPNINAVKRICEKVSRVKIISSGGISSLGDIKNLFRDAPDNLEAAIIGKALYEEKFRLEDAIAQSQSLPA
ncbi:MAG TPA: 1-(5-phosphoribosyl)-5-[(5-phosphoribosylamino)methylideneamino]imidazole-4-carboxamide isomerase [Victivallales bacterium]|nr:1-(5-phosphoribosyl)-5-[(5-phosphoribosylamino)methylideneamino]imidazole-4-carboxamide isomerase [Victivallales bacterium]